jgi:hypothetical protein
MMDAKLEVLAAKMNYDMCKALTPDYLWRESAADTILQGLFERVLNQPEPQAEQMTPEELLDLKAARDALWREHKPPAYSPNCGACMRLHRLDRIIERHSAAHGEGEKK